MRNVFTRPIISLPESDIMINYIIAVFKDLYGNLWDLLELNKELHISVRAV